MSSIASTAITNMTELMQDYNKCEDVPKKFGTWDSDIQNTYKKFESWKVL